jgi:hypothetical protein
MYVVEMTSALMLSTLSKHDFPTYQDIVSLSLGTYICTYICT